MAQFLKKGNVRHVYQSSANGGHVSRENRGGRSARLGGFPAVTMRAAISSGSAVPAAVRNGGTERRVMASASVPHT